MNIPKIFRKLNTKRILILIGIIIVGGFIIGNFIKKGNNELKLEKVVRGTISQEVSETGTVEPVQDLNLGFKTAGRIEKINVEVGDTVEKGSELVSLDKSQLYIQLNQAQAVLAISQAQYDKLLAGYTTQEIKISEDARNASQNNLNSAYNDALNGLEDAYLKIYNAYNVVKLLQNTYFGTADQEGIKVSDNKNIISESLDTVKLYLDKAKENLNHDDIDSALLKTGIALSDSSNALKIIRETCEQGVYYSRVSATDKSSLDTQRTNINTALTSITNTQQTVSSDKIALQKAEDELALKKAPAQQEDINLYQAQVNEAQAKVVLLEDQIGDAVLRSPIKGIITKVDKKVGETIQPTETPISLISLDPLQIKVDIYEEDIVKIKNGDSVDIKIAAFPNEVLFGRVVAIDPAGKLVEDVVYYGVTIAFDEAKEGVRSGMTVDVVIKTAEKENVLTISKAAISENGKTTVKVFKNEKIEEREVQVGLEGNDNRVEIISGLSEGEEVVIE